jgi:hypothetical protein
MFVIAGSKSHRAEVLRFSKLFNSAKLYSIDQYLLSSCLPDERAREALTPPTGILDMVSFGQLTRNWRERMMSSVFAKRKENKENVENDARMLARLEWINAKLDGGPFGLVLITGSQLIATVASGYQKSKDAPNFSELFIRSPKAFLGDHQVVWSVGKPHEAITRTDWSVGRRLQDWLNAVLDAYSRLREAPKSDPPHRTYLSFLTQAYILGATNRWQLCAVTAALAVSVARDFRDQDINVAKQYRVSGREAAFWRAYSLRSAARRDDDLNMALESLKLAREYAAEDLSEVQNLDIREIRFDAEELAIKWRGFVLKLLNLKYRWRHWKMTYELSLITHLIA